MISTGKDYSAAKETDLSREAEPSLYYDDHLYASIGFGISILPEEADKEERLSSFLSSAFEAIETRILSCGLLYSMMVSVTVQYFLYCRLHNEKSKYFLGIAVSGIAPFALFAAVVFAVQAAAGLPVIFPNAHTCLLIIVSFCSVTAGNCVLAAVLSALPHKVPAAVLAIPLVFCLFIAAANFEFHLYTAKTVESFDYFYENYAYAPEEDHEGVFYPDAEHNILYLDGAEFHPETVDNPAYYPGWKRAGAFLLELADPYSGSDLLITETIADMPPIPLGASVCYIIKAGLWTAAAFLFIRKRGRAEA